MNLILGDTALIVATCAQQGLLRNQAAYVLATAFHESDHTMKPINEIWGPTAAQRRYEGRVDLGNIHAGDGRRFAGRGYVQITGRRNYTDWSKRLGVDLTADPTLALKAANAVRILVEGMKLGTFTGKKLADYITLSSSDFTNARRIINGEDRAELIAGYAKQYDALLIGADYGRAPIAPVPQPAPATPKPPVAPPVPVPVPKPASKAASIAAFLALAAMAIAGWWHHLTDLFWSVF